MLNIGPFRILDGLKTEDKPSKKNTKQQNADMVKEADKLIVHIDKDFFKPDKSIGTKVEIANNSSKIDKVMYYGLPPKDELSKSDLISWVKKQKLPSYEEYISS